jgi:hypothetical protein
MPIPHPEFNTINEVIDAVNQGKKVYVCYDHHKAYHSGLIQKVGKNRYVRTFLGMKMEFKFNEGKNHNPQNYYSV